jgi:uncharacterized membrane protein
VRELLEPQKIAELPAAPGFKESDSRKSTLFIGLLLIALAASVRIPFLNARGYLLDEAWTAELASGRGSEHLQLPKDTILQMPVFFSLTGQNASPWWRVWARMQCTHPPLYFIGLRLWMEVFGTGDVPERSFSVLASLIGVALLYDVARLCNGRSVGIWACILMALAQPQVQYARETRNYAWLIVTGLMVLDALIRIEKFGTNRRRLAALMIGVLATLLTHYFGIGLLIGSVLYAVIRMRGRERAQILRRFLLAAVVFICVWGPFMWQQRGLASTSDESTNFLLDTSPSHLMLTFRRLAFLPGVLLAEPSGIAIYFCAAGAIIYVLPLLMLRHRPDLLIWIACMFGVIGIVALLDFARDTRHLGWIRYTLLAGPAVYVLIPAMAAGIKHLAWLRHGIPAVAVLYCLWALPGAYRSGFTDPKIVAAQLQSEVQKQDILLFISTGKNEWWGGGQCLVIARYLRSAPNAVALLNSPAGGEVTTRALASPHIFAFSLRENPADFVHGIEPQSVIGYPGLGRLWVLHSEFGAVPSTPSP